MTDEPTHLDDELDAVLIGGREPGIVRLVDYDPAWPGALRVPARAHRSRTRPACAEHPSTSVRRDARALDSKRAGHAGS